LQVEIQKPSTCNFQFTNFPIFQVELFLDCVEWEIGLANAPCKKEKYYEQ